MCLNHEAVCVMYEALCWLALRSAVIFCVNMAFVFSEAGGMRRSFTGICWSIVVMCCLICLQSDV